VASSGFSRVLGEEHKGVFRVKVLGLYPGAAPFLFLAGALHTLPGLGFPDDPREGPTISSRTLCGEPRRFHIGSLFSFHCAHLLVHPFASRMIACVFAAAVIHSPLVMRFSCSCATACSTFSRFTFHCCSHEVYDEGRRCTFSDLLVWGGLDILIRV